MNQKQRNNLIAVLLLGLCVAGSIWGLLRNKTLRKEHQIGTARIISFSSGGRGNAGGIWIDFVLDINGREYKASSLYSTKDFAVADIRAHMLNETFPAVYYPQNPKVSSIMIIPKDFARYGYSFPDSLNWVLQYFTK